jgi:hypothetical protein
MLAKLKRLFIKPKRPRQLATSEDATADVAELFSAHGLPVDLEKGWVVARSGALRAQARIFVSPNNSDHHQIQLDVQVVGQNGVDILESVVGLGPTPHDAIRESVYSFAQASFHVIFSALTGKPCSHCDVEDWLIGGVPKTVFLGMVTGRADTNDNRSERMGWFHVVEAAIKNLQLPAGTHWIRFYHAELPRGGSVNEALLDNVPHDGLQSALASFAWPKTGRFLFGPSLPDHPREKPRI